MGPVGIRSKLTLSYAALFILVVALLGGVFVRALQLQIDRVRDQRLEHLCTGLWGYIEFRDNKPALAYNPEDHSILDFLRAATRYYQLYDGETGGVLLASEDSTLLHLTLPPASAVRLVHDPGFDEASPLAHLRFRSMVFRSDARRPYVLRVGLSMAGEQTSLHELSRLLLLLLPVGLAGAGLIGWFMSGRALKPVQALRLAAHDISISNLDRRLPTRGAGDELDSLADTFNQVFSRLAESVSRMKQFTAGISHELRTPLACLQGEAELALRDESVAEPYRRVLASQLEEFHKLTTLINRLTMLARAEAGEIHLAAEQFDLSALLTSLVEQIKFIAESRQIQLRLRCPQPVLVVGDPQWLQRAVLNLLDNALKFSPQGGEVTLASAVREGWAVVEVFDTGIGILAQDLPRIFDPFYRAESSRSKRVDGIGLGLTITKWIVEAHRGSIHVTSEPGAGSCFTLRLPPATCAGERHAREG